MFHLLAYTSGALAVASNPFDTPALTDDIFVVSAATSHFLMDDDVAVVAAWAGSTSLDRARIVIPSFRNLGLPYIRPPQVAILPATNANFAAWFQNPITLPRNEDVAVEMSVTAAGPERGTALLWVAKSLDPMPIGQCFPLRFTSATAAVANTWTTVTITLEQALPPGRYALCMSELFSTNGIAHRWIVPNSLYRPGALSGASTGIRLPAPFYEFQFGKWGEFENTVLPRLQVLCNAADAAHVGFMWVVPLSGQDRLRAA